jgi:hypothetical protein
MISFLRAATDKLEIGLYWRGACDYFGRRFSDPSAQSQGIS